MIPEFPEFKKLEFSDKADVEQFTKDFPPYSDFNFVSMWSWDIKNEMSICKLNKNLVVKFTDYLTGDPFYSFIGQNNITETAKILLDFSEKSGEFNTSLNLIPKDVADHIDLNEVSLAVKEMVDHNDYVYSIQDLVSYEGSTLKTQRNTLNSFQRKYPDYKSQQINLTDPVIYSAILKLYKKWETSMNTSVPHEFLALQRCLSIADKLPIFAIGIFVDDELIGFNINEIDSSDFATCFFAKGNIEYKGIYSVLMNDTAKFLLEIYNVKFFNYEQDLGLFNLRKSKKAFNPIYFLKKYCILKKAE